MMTYRNAEFVMIVQCLCTRSIPTVDLEPSFIFKAISRKIRYLSSLPAWI